MKLSEKQRLACLSLAQKIDCHIHKSLSGLYPYRVVQYAKLQSGWTTIENKRFQSLELAQDFVEDRHDEYENLKGEDCFGPSLPNPPFKDDYFPIGEEPQDIEILRGLVEEAELSDRYPFHDFAITAQDQSLKIWILLDTLEGDFIELSGTYDKKTKLFYEDCYKEYNQ